MAKQKPLTVADLRHFLRNESESTPVLLGTDSAEVRLLGAVDEESRYVADSPKGGHLDPGDDKAVACVVLWPVN